MKVQDLFVIAVGVGAAASLYYGLKGRKVSGTPAVNRPTNASEVDALTRMILVETSFNSPPEEMRGILQVALNRAQKRGSSVVSVVAPPGIPLWNGSSAYRDWYYQGAERYGESKFRRARAFVEDYLSGRHPNPIGNRTNFVHISGMARCGGQCGEGKVYSKRSGECYTCANSTGRRCEDTGSTGMRCLPSWIQETVPDMIEVGRARFSRGVA